MTRITLLELTAPGIKVALKWHGIFGVELCV